MDDEETRYYPRRRHTCTPQAEEPDRPFRLLKCPLIVPSMRTPAPSPIARLRLPMRSWDTLRCCHYAPLRRSPQPEVLLGNEGDCSRSTLPSTSPEFDAFLNFAGSRPVYSSTSGVFKYPQIKSLAPIAEGVPERRGREEGCLDRRPCHLRRSQAWMPQESVAVTQEGKSPHHSLTMPELNQIVLTV